MARSGLPSGSAAIRSYCAQVFRQARIWHRIEKSVRVAEFTFPGDPARLDYSYHRNGTRGFVHTLSVTRAPQDAKSLSYNVKHIAEKARYHTEFAAVTDDALSRDNDRHRFVLDTLREVGVEPGPMAGLPPGSAPASGASRPSSSRKIPSSGATACTSAAFPPKCCCTTPTFTTISKTARSWGSRSAGSKSTGATSSRAKTKS